jgi:heme/copper-type cytochrome/quinol oxidase subunit 3
MSQSPATVIRRLPAMRLARDSARRIREPPPPGAPPISNARIAVATLLVAETMFFSGLIGAYLVFRVGTPVWPPPNLPRLPMVVTWINTLVLMASGITMVRAARAARRDDARALKRGLAATAVLGLTFLAVQGSEWARLIQHGLTISSGSYGATFYTLIGLHAAHVVGAACWLGLVWWWARRGEFSGGRDTAVEACTIYWVFVCVLWLALFALVYTW